MKSNLISATSQAQAVSYDRTCSIIDLRIVILYQSQILYHPARGAAICNQVGWPSL